MLQALVGTVRRKYRETQLSRVCRDALARDARGLPGTDWKLDECVRAGVEWICRAQDRSASADGGVAHNYSLLKGWATSYPETTGYIIPTLLAYSAAYQDPAVVPRVRRMLDWLVSLQFPEGPFQGGRIGRKPVVPVTFVTGQILLGLAEGVRCFGGAYYQPVLRTAQWLRDTMDPDGCWRGGRSPFAKGGEATYETHVAWGLFEAARLAPNEGFGEAGLRNVDWALSHQRENGWIANCCLDDPSKPLTHTLGYALRGVIEAHRFRPGDHLLRAARKTADGLLRVLQPDAFLPGCIRSDWSGAVKWACLTGTAQVSICWLLLYELTGAADYRDAALAANRYLRRTVELDGDPDRRGALKGAFPVNGDFHPFEYPNWATKFFLDALLLEKGLRKL